MKDGEKLETDQRGLELGNKAAINLKDVMEDFNT